MNCAVASEDPDLVASENPDLVASEDPDLDTPALPATNSSAHDGDELRDAGQSLLLLSIIYILSY